MKLLDSVTETTYPPRLRLRQHAHASAYLCFVKDGGFTERQGRRVEQYDRTWCVFRPPHDEHANEFDEAGAVCLNIDVGDSWLDRLREPGLTDRRVSVQSPFVAQLRGRLEDELRAPDSASSVVVESLALEVLVFAWRNDERSRVQRSRWLEKARELIECDFASPLSLARIASVVDIHPVHLARQFRAVHGCTVGDYIREVRIAFARRQLTTTDVPISEIALSSGFFDQSQLTRAFKRVTGRTPAAYRTGRR
ncbi:MAG: helix-turn-helix transcriptional regulator [Thermoanaerobaculia bacterium]